MVGSLFALAISTISSAWLVTIPAAAVVAWIAYAILHTAGL